MGTQLFKTNVPIHIILDFIKLICEEKDMTFILNKIIYKQAEYNNNILPFIELLKPYYYKSKLYYLERKLDYVKFMTIIRQLCNLYNIDYTSKIVYNNSNYEIEYIIKKDPIKGI
jgi:hypothetical protein